MKRLDWGQPKGPEDWEYVYRALTMIREASFRTEQSDTDISTLQDDVADLEAGNIPTINLTGGQITFPATQAASAGANVLDDYEEGTFTPGFSFGGGTTGITYAVQNGIYTKIGRAVLFYLTVELTSKGSSTGTWLVTGLPFTAAATHHAAVAVYGERLNFTASSFLEARVLPATTTIELVEYQTNPDNTATMDHTWAENDTEISLDGLYFV